MLEKPFQVGSLAAWYWSSEKKSKARVLLIHGLHEHCHRHLNTITQLHALGLEVISFDLRGMGQSGGMRQWVNHFLEYVEDTASVFQWIQRELPPKPLFMLGHSLGGGNCDLFCLSLSSCSFRSCPIFSWLFDWG